MTAPLVSIVICCHNRRDYLRETLESVFAQNYQPVEIIVMDDGSTDGTDELMASYGDAVRYYRQDPQGIAVARTNASKLARGEYIAYQDDDDLMPADRIPVLLEALESVPGASFATGDFALIDAESRLTGHRWLPGAMDESGPGRVFEDGQEAVLWPHVPAVPHTTLFRRALGEQVGWFDHDFRYACSDADFLARLGRLGPVVYVRRVVSYYRRGHAAIWNDDVRTSCSRVQLWEKHLQLIGSEKPALRSRLQERVRSAAVSLERARQRGATASGPLDLDHWIARAMKLLPALQRLQFDFQARIKMPLRKLVKGTP